MMKMFLEVHGHNGDRFVINKMHIIDMTPLAMRVGTLISGVGNTWTVVETLDELLLNLG